VREAAARGIRPGQIAVVNLQIENRSETRLVESLGMRAVRVPQVDNLAFMTMRPFERVLRVVADPSVKLVVVHCRAGIGRTGQAVAAIRIAYDGMTPEAAIAEMEQYLGASPLALRWSVRRFAHRWREGRIRLDRR
jgi:hypothetical protein